MRRRQHVHSQRVPHRMTIGISMHRIVEVTSSPTTFLVRANALLYFAQSTSLRIVAGIALKISSPQDSTSSSTSLPAATHPALFTSLLSYLDSEVVRPSAQRVLCGIVARVRLAGCSALPLTALLESTHCIGSLKSLLCRRTFATYTGRTMTAHSRVL